MPELLEAMNAAAEQARANGANEAQVHAAREAIADGYRAVHGNSSRQPVNEWRPLIPADQKEPEPMRAPIHPGRRERKGDRF